MSKAKARRGASPQRTAAKRDAVLVTRPSTEEANARKVDEVEQGLAALPEVPIDVLDEVPPVEPETSAVTATRVRNLFDQVKQQGENYKRAREKLSEKEAELEARGLEIKEQESGLAIREAELAAAEKDLQAQRLAAKAGFVDELRATTKEVSEKIDTMLIDAATWGAELKAKAVETTAAEHQRLTLERAQLDTDWESLRKRQAEVRALEVEVSSTTEFLKKKESSLDSVVQRQVETQVTLVRDDLEDTKSQLHAASARAASKDNEVRQLRNELARFGDDPDGMKRRIEELSEELRIKKDELARRPPEDEVSDLRSKVLRVTDAESEAAHWRSRYDQIDSQLRRYLVNVGELEVLRDERDALASQRETLRQAIAQQKSDWEELQAKESSTNPFPACSGYDADATLARELVSRSFGTLADLVNELRNRMAANPTTSFYYSESDVRLFLAGLASSRLHLLQGISGTGKTSLPREFFKALAGDAAVQIVEVQAGWRDKDDLFGYYNAFEKRFAESEFTKALYRALLPANADRPMVVVLDEMNLAHPEQYFSVMLSLLENSSTAQGYLDLLTSQIPHLPKMFEGSRLPLPKNVWFVGTANHDETTVAFADKTYDRAHVQVLPSMHVPFQASNPGRAADPVSFELLDEAFMAATRNHTKDVAQVKDFLRSGLREEFEKFGVGWGNRLERQIDRFVPVVLAGGGDLTEAVDHLVATKLVRKLEDRFGVRPEDLDALAGNIELHWDQLQSHSRPSKTLEALRSESNKLRGGFGS
ncbi:AAA family ATPase [Rhodococcus sp. IEGM 1351]|uniref:AAA family ATPase n=1 Tax=Rhodococcus sp. IEGM 1351 TaxID=3047089 RepID=UPI0024B65442|nr:AAA family ATPase [Rhodococcus sp. IEGM 1351]MDI9941513.1 AAA family ATPase [Rhodococcus sp. IEGM 1351]